MNRTPTVSIVLTSYNQQVQLERAFNSLINQTFKDIEIIIVDDASTDKISQPYILSLLRQYPEIVKCYFQPQNVGIAKNKNTGFKMARGEYISFLDGDDYYMPQKIEHEVQAFLGDKSIDVVYSDFRYEDPNGKFLGKWSNVAQVPEGFVFEEVFCREFPGNVLFRFELMKAEVLKKIGYYDEGISAYHDWDSRIRYSKFSKLKFIDYVGSVYVQDPAGISRTKKQLYLIDEMQLVYKKNKPLLNDVPEERGKRIEKLLQEKILYGRVIHSNSSLQFLQSVFYYLLLRPANLKFVLSQVYGRVKQLIVH